MTRVFFLKRLKILLALPPYWLGVGMNITMVPWALKETTKSFCCFSSPDAAAGSRLAASSSRCVEEGALPCRCVEEGALPEGALPVQLGVEIGMEIGMCVGGGRAAVPRTLSRPEMAEPGWAGFAGPVCRRGPGWGKGRMVIGAGLMF